MKDNNEIFGILNEIEEICQKEKISKTEIHCLYYKVYSTINWLD